MLAYLLKKPLGPKAELVVISFAMAFALFKYNYQISTFFDIMLYDESIRLTQSFNLYAQIGREFFLYEAWLSLLGFFFSDPIHLYITNYVILSSLSAVLLLIFIGQRRGYDIISLWVALIFLVSILNYKTNPHTLRLSLVLTLGLLIFMKKNKDSIKNWVFVSIIGLALLYIRIEYILLTGILCCFIIYKLLQEYRLKNRKRFFIYVTILFAFLFCLSIGNPIYRGNDRSTEAFEVLYAISFVNIKIILNTALDMLAIHIPYFENMSTNSPFLTDPWFLGSDLFREKFGISKGIINNFLYNPFAFISHVFRNILIFWIYTAYTLLPIAGANFFLIPAVITFVVLPLLYFRRSRQEMSKITREITVAVFKPKLVFLYLRSWFASTQAHQALLLGIFSTACIGFLIFSPHWSYMIFPLGLAIGLVSASLPPIQKITRVPIPSWVLLFFYAFTIYCIPYRAPYGIKGEIGLIPTQSYQLSPCSQRNKIQVLLSIYNTYSSFSKQSNHKKLVVGYFGDPSVYLKKDKVKFDFVQATTNRNNFLEYIKETNISLIDVNKRLLNFYRNKVNLSFDDLIKEPERYGYRKHHIKGCEDFFLVRK